MRTTRLGARGPVTSVMGLGLAAVGRPAYITLGRDRDLGPDRSVARLRRRSHELLDAAHRAGVRYLDAARSYGRAEAFLGDWLRDRDIAPRAVTVGSKWGYTYTGQWRTDADVHEVKDHSLAAFTRQLAETHALLGDRLDLYQIHSASLETGVLADRAVLSALVTLADTGTLVGLSVSGAGQGDTVRAALAATVDGCNPFAAVQATWNLHEPSAGPALAEAAAAGWGVIVKEPVANGRLTPAASAVPTALATVARRHGVTVDAVAIAAAIAQPFSDVVLSGAATEEQLRSNLAAVEVDLEENDLAELGALSEPPAAYWATRGDLGWR